MSVKLRRKWDSYKLTLGTEIDKLTFQSNDGNVYNIEDAYSIQMGSSMCTYLKTF